MRRVKISASGRVEVIDPLSVGLCSLDAEVVRLCLDFGGTATFLIVITQGTLVWDHQASRYLLTPGSAVCGPIAQWSPAICSDGFSARIALAGEQCLVGKAKFAIGSREGADAFGASAYDEIANSKDISETRLLSAMMVVADSMGGAIVTPSLVVIPTELPDRIASLVSKVRSKPEAPWSVPEAATWVGFSHHYFSRIFRERFGQSFHDAVEAIRLDKAVELLLNSDLSIERVALKAGFGSGTTLRQAFRDRIGLVPSDLRDRHVHQSGQSAEGVDESRA